MSEFDLEEITDRAGTGAPNFTHGFNINGSDSGIVVFTHTVGTSEPSSPSNGDTWWNTDNDSYHVYVDGGWKAWLGDTYSTFSWGGDRGVFANGYENGNFRNDIDYVDITTAGNATDFGDATVGRNGARSTGSTTRFVFGLGWTGSVYTLTLDYITTATTGNAADFGDHTVTNSRGTNIGIVSSGTRGLFAGGYASAFTNAIHYITIANTGNTTDFGDLTVARNNVAGAGDGSRGLFAVWSKFKLWA